MTVTQRPKLLDLFCCEGGAAAGYTRAGFVVDGVDLHERLRKRYLRSGAKSFTARNVIGVSLAGYAAAHASPPCEDHSPTMGFGLQERGTGWLLPYTIKRLKEWGKPFVVENVVSASTKEHMPGALLLCGSMFGLGAHDSAGTYRVLSRHRLFLTNWKVSAPSTCSCAGHLVGGVYGNGEQGATGGRGYGFAADAAREAMQMPWATRDGCKQAIPPAYTYYLGSKLIKELR